MNTEDTATPAPAPRRRRRQLVPQQRLRQLTRRSDRRAALQCLGHGGLLLATTVLVLTANGAWLLPAWLAQSVVLVALFAPLHEASHRTVFASRRLNRWLCWPGGLVLGLPPTWFRHYHLAHHRHTQDPERDPELAEPKPTTFAQYLWVVTGIPYWRGVATNLWRLAAGRTAGMFYLPAAERAAAIHEARVLLGVYAGLVILSLAWLTPVVLSLWLLPILLGQPALRVFLLAEHTGCSQTADGLTNTRTTLASRPVRLLAWNMPYHAEHHLYPAVPFHALATLHSEVEHRLQVIAPGYPAAHRDIRAGLDPR